jgi:hypothetical protein
VDGLGLVELGTCETYAGVTRESFVTATTLFS